MVTSLENSIPVEMTPLGGSAASGAAPDPQDQTIGTPDGYPDDKKLITYVTNWRNELRKARYDKQNIWTECWHDQLLASHHQPLRKRPRYCRLWPVPPLLQRPR